MTEAAGSELDAEVRVELGVAARVDVALDFDLGGCAGGQTVAASLAVTPRWDPSLGRGLDVIAAVGVIGLSFSR